MRQLFLFVLSRRGADRRCRPAPGPPGGCVPPRSQGGGPGPAPPAAGGGGERRGARSGSAPRPEGAAGAKRGRSPPTGGGGRRPGRPKSPSSRRIRPKVRLRKIFLSGSSGQASLALTAQHPQEHQGRQDPLHRDARHRREERPGQGRQLQHRPAQAPEGEGCRRPGPRRAGSGLPPGRRCGPGRGGASPPGARRRCRRRPRRHPAGPRAAGLTWASGCSRSTGSAKAEPSTTPAAAAQSRGGQSPPASFDPLPWPCPLLREFSPLFYRLSGKMTSPAAGRKNLNRKETPLSVIIGAFYPGPAPASPAFPPGRPCLPLKDPSRRPADAPAQERRTPCPSSSRPKW